MLLQIPHPGLPAVLVDEGGQGVGGDGDGAGGDALVGIAGKLIGRWVGRLVGLVFIGWLIGVGDGFLSAWVAGL